MEMPKRRLWKIVTTMQRINPQTSEKVDFTLDPWYVWAAQPMDAREFVFRQQAAGGHFTCRHLDLNTVAIEVTDPVELLKFKEPV